MMYLGPKWHIWHCLGLFLSLLPPTIGVLYGWMVGVGAHADYLWLKTWWWWKWKEDSWHPWCGISELVRLFTMRRLGHQDDTTMTTATKANAGPQQPPTANAGQQWLIKANAGQQWPTTASTGQRQLKVNAGQCRPTKDNTDRSGCIASRAPLVGMFFFLLY